MPYAIGFLLINAGVTEIGMLSVAVGMIRDWRIWLIGVGAFLIGFNWGG
jgi:hypothetical protein